MRKYLLLLYLLSISFGSKAIDMQAELNAALIPDSLKKNANAVVRYATTQFEYHSATSGVEKQTYAITILNKKGEDLSVFKCYGDKFITLSSFSGKMYDANGNQLKKYKMSDVISSEWSAELATDALHYYFSCDAPSFPFTIVYEYELKWNNGILSFPAFFPQDDYNLSLEKASYQLVLPEGLSFKSKVVNIQNSPLKTTAKGTTTYEWKVNNLTAIEDEPLDADLIEYIPFIYAGPQSFIYDKVPGIITDWNSLGKWSYELIQNRDLLPESAKNMIIGLTKNATTDREKVKILYDYLGQTTHYISIQLGIGGLQPMPAAEVDNAKFGDCKALTNYLKAMLAVIGIPSNYCVIRFDSKEKKLFNDYPNFNQTNHVILQVPLPKDTLWLECTNPRTPLGFAHNGISGHDVLVCTPDGGKIQQIPDYPDSLNIEQNNAIVDLSPDGSAKVNMKKDCFAKIYDDYDWFPFAKASEQADNLREDINLPNVTMGSYQFKEDKSAHPCLTINYNWITPQYGTKTGNRLFIPVNTLRSTYERMKTSKRVHDMTILKGFKDIDSICIRIPDGFAIESIPLSSKQLTPFGTLQTQITSTGKEIQIKQSVYVPSGKYGVSSYPEFIGFFDKISTAYKGKIILRKLVN